MLKNSKNVIFPRSVFSFDSMSEDFLLEQKSEKYQNTFCVFLKCSSYEVDIT